MEQPCFRPTVCMYVCDSQTTGSARNYKACQPRNRPSGHGRLYFPSLQFSHWHDIPLPAHRPRSVVSLTRKRQNAACIDTNRKQWTRGEEGRMPLAGKVVPGAIGRLTDLGKQRKGPVRQAFLSFDRGSDCFKHRLQLYYRLYMPRNVMFQCHARAAAAADLMMIMMMMKSGRLNLGR